MVSGASLARLGGDEFACAIPVNEEQYLLDAARKLTVALRDPFALDGMSIVIGASIGVSMSGPDLTSSTEALRCADVAMYEAKRLKSEVEVYQAETDMHSREQLALVDELRDAIAARALTLHYQPTLDMKTGEVRGVEALARWHHPEMGLLYPDRFIPLAERYGLMPRLTRAVLDQAVAHAARLDMEGHDLQMSVNISRYDLVDKGFGNYINALLTKYGYPAKRLTLEITETALASDFDRVEQCIQQLRARGLKISIDDFGVGYSSMSQLLGLAVDELKIDRSFVMNISSDSRSLAIVRSSVELARALGLTVVAEGIEEKGVLQTLQDIGTDVGQGYVIARPLDTDQLDIYLTAGVTDSPLLDPVPLAAAS
jgi:predicted signal transduction protein with EAL and GGDEF domain